MKLTPISTKIFQPPKDDIFPELSKVLTDLQEEDIILITSKIVSIHEGRCVPVSEASKKDLIKDSADYIYKVPDTERFLTITNNTLIGGAGIDESNANDHYILLPEDSYKSAKEIWEFLKKEFNIDKLGVIITDSHSVPCRYGAMSISIGSWGFEPIEYHAGKKDLFDRALKFSKTNIADSLAASSAVVSGECAEATPIVIARDVPNIKFTNKNHKDELFAEMEDDRFGPLFEQFKKGGKK